MRSIYDVMKNIQVCDKLLVYGFVRENTISLQPYQHEFPEPITIICIWYFFHFETYRVWSYEEMGLHKELIRGITDFQAPEPSYITHQSLLAMLSGRHIVIRRYNQMYVYMTAAIHMVDFKTRQCQALVLTGYTHWPTQVLRAARSLAKYCDVEQTAMMHVDNFVRGNIHRLSEGPAIVIGTPNRILDLILRGALCLNVLKLLICSELHEKFATEHKQQLADIIKYLPKQDSCQIALIGKEMPEQLLKMFEHHHGEMFLSICK